MSTQRTEGGLYLVTLNNDAPISVNAGDHRIAHRAIEVRRGDVKFGKAANLVRRCHDYRRTFGRENVNFFILAYLPGGERDRDRAESDVLETLTPFRIRGATGRLNEWLTGVSASRVRKSVLEALARSDIEHIVVPRDDEGSTDAHELRNAEKTLPLTRRNRSKSWPVGRSAAPLPAGSDARQTVEQIDLLSAENLLTDQGFARLHHQASVSMASHRNYCADLAQKNSDFRQGPTGERNRNVCRRLAFIAHSLRSRVPRLDRDEIEGLIQAALRNYPL